VADAPRGSISWLISIIISSTTASSISHHNKVEFVMPVMFRPYSQVLVSNTP
jgi:hypothetical protein